MTRMQFFSNVILLVVFSGSLVLFALLTHDILNYVGQQSVLELFIWFTMGLISFVCGKAILLFNPEEQIMIKCPACKCIQSDEYEYKINESDVDLEHCTCEECSVPLS